MPNTLENVADRRKKNERVPLVPVHHLEKDTFLDASLFPSFQNVPQEFCYVAVDESILPTSIMTFLAYGKLVARNWI